METRKSKIRFSSNRSWTEFKWKCRN